MQDWVEWLMLWLGATTPHVGKGHTAEHVSLWGGGAWKGWAGEGSILHLPLGMAKSHVTEEGVDCGPMCPSPPWWHDYAAITVEGMGCGADRS